MNPNFNAFREKRNSQLRNLGSLDDMKPTGAAKCANLSAE
jgi:hypothetical protein